MLSEAPPPLRNVREARYALCAYSVALLTLTSFKYIVEITCAAMMPGVPWTEESTQQSVLVLGKAAILGGVAYLAWKLPPRRLAQWFLPALAVNAAVVIVSVSILGRNASVEHLSFIGFCLLGAFCLRTRPAIVVTGVSISVFVVAHIIRGATVSDVSNLVASIAFSCGFVYSLTWASSRQQANVVQLREKLTTDALTGLSNRRIAEPYLSSDSDGAQVCAGLVLVDLDGFKEINDKHGHLVGDAVLRLVASVLVAVSEKCQEKVEVCRLGGDEFALVVCTTDRSVVESVASSVTECFHHLTVDAPNGASLPVDASVGCGHWPTDSMTAASLYAAADERMYAAKEARKAKATVEQNEGCGVPSSPSSLPAHQESSS